MAYMTPRQWLQRQVNTHKDAETRRQAQAALNVVGDDWGIDGRFIDQDTNHYNTSNSQGVGYGNRTGYGVKLGKAGLLSNGYSAYDLNRGIVPQMQKMYDADKAIWKKEQGNQGSVPSRSAGGYYSGGYDAERAAREAQEKRFYESLLNALPGQKKLDSERIDAKYETSINDLSSQRKSGMSNLDREQQKLDRQRSKSYGQIQDDTQKILQGANTTLGMYGAGNSSATQMAAFGASDAANKQSSDITEQFNEQTGDISLARKELEDEFEQKKAKTDDWKKDQHHELDKEYRNLENNYRGRIGGQANLDAVVNTFKNMKAPEVKLKDLSDYKTDGLDQVDLTGQVQAPTLEPNQAQKFFTATTSANKKKKEEDERDKTDLLGL